MPIIDIYLAQLTDIFRVGLLIALLLTAANTAQALNRWIPIALGLVFVAVLIPTSFGAKEGQDTVTAIAVGLFSNATILAVLLAAQQVYRRLAR
jgi:glucose uptake protein GlcU